MTAHSLKVALLQQSISANKADNLAKCISQIRVAACQGAKIILLPELHNTAYFCQTENTDNFDLAEPIPGPSSEIFSALAAELNIVIVCSLFERRSAGLYHNTVAVLDTDGSLAGIYRKMHIPDDPGYHEKFYFTPGDLGFHPIKTSIANLGILICWDQWFPEAARLMTLAGADLLLFPTAIGWDPLDDNDEKHRQLDAWKTIQRGHAIANGIPVMSCNRFGFEASPADKNTGIDFWGSSFIAGPQGELLASAASNETALLTAELDLKHSEQVRRIWPYLRDRRIDAYQDLLLRFRD